MTSNTRQLHSAEEKSSTVFRISSDIETDVWHPHTAAQSYEWWYFDAVSDDGRDTLVIIFLDNFIFSPRYHRAGSNGDKLTASADVAPARFPGLAFCLYRDGKVFIRAFNEYAEPDFTASTRVPSCRIGQSGFTFDASTGTYHLHIETSLREGKTLRAQFAWHVVEGSLIADTDAAKDVSMPAHEWNMVAPRCRVEGKLEIARKGNIAPMTWRGTGYHDHNRDTRPLVSTVNQWQWGRAHFQDATAVFYRFQPPDADVTITRLFIIENNQLVAPTVSCSLANLTYNIFGLHYPREISLTSADAATMLSIRSQQVLDASFFYLRFGGTAQLTRHGKTQRAPLVAEHLAPQAFKWRWLDWLVDMRIARDGKTAFLP